MNKRFIDKLKYEKLLPFFKAMELKGGIVNFVVDAFVVEDARVVEDDCVGASVAKLTGWGGFIAEILTFPTKPLGEAAVILSLFEEIVSIVKL